MLISRRDLPLSGQEDIPDLHDIKDILSGCLGIGEDE